MSRSRGDPLRSRLGLESRQIGAATVRERPSAGVRLFLLLALFHVVVDVAGVRRLVLPLVVIGSNALLAYVLEPFVYLAMRGLREKLLPADFPSLPLELLLNGSELLLLWLLLWWLYRQRLFLRA